MSNSDTTVGTNFDETADGVTDDAENFNITKFEATIKQIGRI